MVGIRPATSGVTGRSGFQGAPYDLRLDHFSCRSEIRMGRHRIDDRALQPGISQPEDFLGVVDFGYRGLSCPCHRYVESLTWPCRLSRHDVR